jgi:hypothetical protein
VVRDRSVDALRARLLGLSRRTRRPDGAALAERILLIVYGLYAIGGVVATDDTVPAAVALAEETVARTGARLDPTGRRPPTSTTA